MANMAPVSGVSPTTLTQAISFFTPSNTVASKGLLTSQINPSAPSPSALTSGTGLLVPDTHLSDRLQIFDPDLYDLRNTSHLMRFLNALLGNSGVGQLRKQYTTARMATALTGSHFFDLDRFYGAIFSAPRTSQDLIDIDPTVDTATSGEWDSIRAADAIFREKIIALAKGIAMGATVPGMIAVAQAICGSRVRLYEAWAVLDPLGRENVGSDPSTNPNGYRLYSDVESDFATYTAMNSFTWGDIMLPASSRGTIAAQTYAMVETNFASYTAMEADSWTQLETFVQSPITSNYIIPFGDRSSFTIVPLKNYADLPDITGTALMSDDAYALRQVLNVVKPAGAFMNVNPTGFELLQGVPILSIFSPSEYWDVVAKVRPNPSLPSGTAANVYPLSSSMQATVSNDALIAGLDPQQAIQTASLQQHELPTTAFSGYQGAQVTYNADIASVGSYSLDASGNLVTNISTDIVTYADGVQISYVPALGVADGIHALGATYAQSGVMSAPAYAGTRTAVSSGSH